MTIKQRLFRSNILMIAVPVAAAAAAGLMCIGFIWIAMINDIGLGIHDQDEFELACEVITENVEHKLKNTGGYLDIQALLDNNSMRLQIESQSETLFEYGEKKQSDSDLKAALVLLGSDATVTSGGRAMQLQRIEINKKCYEIYISGSYRNIRSYASLKTAIAVMAVLILLIAIVSVIITNRYLTKNVLRRIEEPLDILADGVHELKTGRLDYRISYDRQDEFKPVCEDFNEMAGQLKSYIERLRQQEQSRKELVAGISHDIRTPLTSIQAYVEGLIDGIAGTPQKQLYLQTIKSKSEDITHIVSQLFLFSKMELGDYIEHPCRLRLDEVIERTVDSMRAEYLEKGLEINISLEETAVKADPVQLERIAANILGNSLKYKNREIGHVLVELKKTEVYAR